MESLLGKWRLLKNEGFDNLKFTRTILYQRKIVGHCSIDLEILKTDIHMKNEYFPDSTKLLKKLFFVITISLEQLVRNIVMKMKRCT